MYLLPFKNQYRDHDFTLISKYNKFKRKENLFFKGGVEVVIPDEPAPAARLESWQRKMQKIGRRFRCANNLSVPTHFLIEPSQQKAIERTLRNDQKSN
jgi:hypothetical protein